MNAMENIKTIENNIFNSISQCLEEGESITASRLFDFYLPQGSKKLKWPKNTYVEVKYRLIYDTLSKIQDLYDNSNAERLIVILITEENTINQIFRTRNILLGRDIEVITYETFNDNLPIKADDTATGKTDNPFDAYTIDRNKSIVLKAKEALKQNRICLFLGAGVSASAGVVTWNNLLEHLCVKKGLAKIDSDIDSVIKGRYIIDEYKKQQKEVPEEFYNDMKSILYANTHSSPLIDAIADLVVKSNVESIISYNYDDLVEQKIKKTKECYSVYDKSRPEHGNALQVYHVHGFIPQNGAWSPIVLGEKEYHKIYQEAYNWGNVEQLHSLCRNVCFFVGLSMNDPNLRRLIDVSIDGSEIEPVHYAFLRRIEYDVPFMEKIMRGFGVNCIWYDKHEDLPKLLKSLIR